MKRGLGKEIFRTLDENITDEIGNVDQYLLERTGRRLPVIFDANISYDYLKARKKDELQKEFDLALEKNQEADKLWSFVPLPERQPWSHLN